MSFIRYAFSFLFIRNWHTGEMELSRSRMALFCAGLFLILLAVTIINILQAPVEYIAP
jgi:hypothetical protein